MNMRAGTLQLLGNRREGLAAVDQHIDRIARPGVRVPCCPSARWGGECAFPADPVEAPPMMRADLAADLASEPAFSAEQCFPYSHRSVVIKAGTRGRLEPSSAQILR